MGGSDSLSIRAANRAVQKRTRLESRSFAQRIGLSGCRSEAVIRSARMTRLAPGAVFLFFCAMMVLHLLWVRTMVPETRGVPLEDIQRQLGVTT